MEGLAIGRIGEVTEEPILDINGIFEVPVKKLKSIYESSLTELIE